MTVADLLRQLAKLPSTAQVEIELISERDPDGDWTKTAAAYSIRCVTTTRSVVTISEVAEA